MEFSNENNIFVKQHAVSSLLLLNTSAVGIGSNSLHEGEAWVFIVTPFSLSKYLLFWPVGE